MSAPLAAYLERLAHPARKAYATRRYAAHVLSGAPAPERPEALDAETAAKIARKVARYAAAAPAPLVAAPIGSCDGLEHLPEAVRAYALEHGDGELLGLVDAFVSPSRAEGDTERLSDYYTPETVPAFIESAEVDVLDLTGLEPTQARELALKLSRWNGGGRVYSRRNGRRYLDRKVRRIDLNDPTVRALPNYDDLLAVVRERGVRA